MSKKHQKFNWQTALGAVAIALGTLGTIESPVIAFPEQTEDGFKLAQVGVRSRINAPTPLNLRPRTHIPLPRSNSHRYRYPKYRDDYGRNRYRYGHGRYHDRHYGHRRDRHHRGTVIIINPSNYNSHSNYDGYIRVIGK